MNNFVATKYWTALVTVILDLHFHRLLENIYKIKLIISITMYFILKFILQCFVKAIVRFILWCFICIGCFILFIIVNSRPIQSQESV